MMDPLTARVARTHLAARQGIGTCPVCFGSFKLKPSTRHGVDKTMPGMVLHGYKRPGTGQVHGNCKGQDWPPFELSKEGSIVWLRALREYEERELVYVESLKRNEIDSLTGALGGEFRRDTTDPLTWERLVERAVKNVEARLVFTRFDMRRLEKAIASWEPQALTPAV